MLGPEATRPVTAARGPAILTRYTVAASLARLADEGARVALLLQVLDAGRGAALGGLLVAALMVPHVVVAPVAGGLADGVRRRRVLYAGSFVAYGVSLLGAALLVSPAPVAAFGLAVAAGCCAPLLTAGLTSVLGELAPDRLPRAFGLDATSYSVAGIAGPGLAAVVAGWWGPLASVAALSGSCAVAAGFVATLPIPHREARPRPRSLGAVRALAGEPALRAVTAASTVSQLGLGALPIVAALLATDHRDPALTGFVLSAMAVGSLCSSLIYARWPVWRWRPEVLALAGVAATTVPFAAVALAGNRWAVLACFGVAGLIIGPQFAAVLTVRDRDAPPEARTQVFTISAGLKMAAAAAGVALAGLATGHGSAALVLAVAGAQLAAAAAAGAALLRRR